MITDEKIDIDEDDLKTYDRIKNTFDTGSLTVKDSGLGLGFLAQPPKNIWRIMPFGKDSNIVMDVPYNLNIWKRLWFKFFLGFHIVKLN
jgi:hypothetical protein